MRLIDADEAKRKFVGDIAKNLSGLNIVSFTIAAGIAEMFDCEDDFPTIEAEPVRHGAWQLMNDTYDRWKEYTCSECNCCVSRKYNYCHNCGARMDGGKGNES